MKIYKMDIDVWNPRNTGICHIEAGKIKKTIFVHHGTSITTKLDVNLF